MDGFFGDLFDFNGDGQIDGLELGAGLGFFAFLMEEEENRRREEAEAEDDDSIFSDDDDDWLTEI